MAEFIRTGALQMAIVPCSVPEGYDEDFAIVGAPYFYDDIDHLSGRLQAGYLTSFLRPQKNISFVS